jgi:hypothetical protein
MPSLILIAVLYISTQWMAWRIRQRPTNGICIEIDTIADVESFDSAG